VVDLAEADCIDQLEAIRHRLRERNLRLPSLLLANKCDRLKDPDAELATFLELEQLALPALAVSAQSGHGLAAIGARLFELLEIVRVYTRAPGHAPEHERPYTLRRGATVRDVAALVHRGLAADLKFARLWGSAEFPGQQVSPEHAVRDRDTVELHW
jgi:hypothetical protein